MFSPTRKTHPIFKIINGSLIDLPAPNNLSIWWNYGSLLVLCLGIQIITGLFLAMYYTPHVDLAFSSVISISRDINNGWILQNIHANGGTWFFICLYLHIGRGIYYGSYMFMETWNIGMVLFILTMATAFMGYVLPWGQMSFWGASVITNLFSAIPYIGKEVVTWLWGGFAVSNPTLNRFFALHFFLPFISAAMVAIHILFLHQTGSNNPLGINSNADKIPFHSYYSTKDVLGMMIMLSFLWSLAMFTPSLFTDPENYNPSNPLMAPMHIKPEWYFLWAYAILRSTPNKLGGVIAMFSAILILMTLPFIVTQKSRGMMYYPMSQFFFWIFIAIFVILTWIGGLPVEAPYELIGQFATCLYFAYFLMKPTLPLLWDTITRV